LSPLLRLIETTADGLDKLGALGLAAHILGANIAVLIDSANGTLHLIPVIDAR